MYLAVEYDNFLNKCQLINQKLEQVARDHIDKMLADANWLVQSRDKIGLWANIGVAVKEYPTDVEPADYVLFVNRKTAGIIEAKRKDEVPKTLVFTKSDSHADVVIKIINELNEILAA